MDAQSEDKQDQKKSEDNKNTQEQQDKKKQAQKSSNEEKFTWHPGDIEVFDSVDDIPGFQAFPLKNKNKPDKQNPDKKEDEK